MKLTDQTNVYFQMAYQYVNHTDKHVYLTGKAGTGKTTFLKHIKESSPKNMVILAPTGVAAINAGGSTIHSFFQLPFGSFLPATEHQQRPDGVFYNKPSLLQHLRYSKQKRQLIQELDLIVIDEVSMVRADLLDAIDTILRHVRKTPDLPFGGTQMLYIGDLFQLPPVVREQEWSVLSQYYQSPFFFNARAILQAPPLYIELKKIYRQSQGDFISLLNNIRNNQVSQKDIDLLKQYYKPDFVPASNDYITLTTHNATAETINQRELQKLKDKAFHFTAEVTGDFNDRMYPAEFDLVLKTGAQVMFIRNDKEDPKRYFNGKLATVSSINQDEIWVKFTNEKGEMKVEKETWENIKYTYNHELNMVEEEVIGTFKQHPLRLAWAITIHKSQGLTFDKAIIDAGSSFAPGQVYVALSRLTSLEGLVLNSPIHSHCIDTDTQAISFAQNETGLENLSSQLRQAQKDYIHKLLFRGFDLNKLEENLKNFNTDFESRKIPHQQKAQELFSGIYAKTKEHQQVALKFQKQLDGLLKAADTQGYAQVHERLKSASIYFSEALQQDLFKPMASHIEEFKSLTKVKQYLKAVKNLATEVKHTKDNMEHLVGIVFKLMKGAELENLLVRPNKEHLENSIKDLLPKLPGKPVKGDSQKLSLQMFKEGKSINEIARERGLSPGTIEGHLASFISTGELQIEEILPQAKINIILPLIDELGDVAAGPIKEKLGEQVSYGEIRAVINHYRKMKSVKV
jgi:hypothetical protein